MKQAQLKTLTFAVVHFTVALSVGWLITGSFVLGSLLAIVEPAVNTLAYYVHETLWQKRDSHRSQTNAASMIA